MNYKNRVSVKILIDENDNLVAFYERGENPLVRVEPVVEDGCRIEETTIDVNDLCNTSKLKEKLNDFFKSK